MNDAISVPLTDQTASTLSEVIANFVEGFDLDQVPVEVIERAKLNILDAIGIGFASV